MSRFKDEDFNLGDEYSDAPNKYLKDYTQDDYNPSNKQYYDVESVDARYGGSEYDNEYSKINQSDELYRYYEDEYSEQEYLEDRYYKDESDNDLDEYEERRRIRKEKMRQRQIEQKKIVIKKRKIALAGILAIFAIVVIMVVVSIFSKENDSTTVANNASTEVKNDANKDKEIKDKDEEVKDTSDKEEATQTQAPSYYAKVTKQTKDISDDNSCQYAILIDRQTNKVIAQKNCRKRVSPASMTKVMTILVAAEHITDYDKKCTISKETTDYCYVHGCSAVGYLNGDKVPVTELFYGTILPSGADAAITLAEYVAGSHEAFVDMMNEKAKELGLSKSTHFMNCVGIYDDNHYSTVYDMAMILEAAMENEFCREVLSTHIYDTKKSKNHPDGISLSNLFLRRVEDQDCGVVTVLGAKTGFVNQSGNCCVSCAVDKEGNEYYLCTVMSAGSWQCIYDHARIYKTFIKDKKK